MNRLLALIPAALLLLYPNLRTAYADWAIVTFTPAGTTAEVNGTALTLPADFTVRLEGYFDDDRARYTIYPQIGVNGHQAVWSAGDIDGSLWCGWNCNMGVFGGHRYDEWTEVCPTFLTAGGYDWDTLLGERVVVHSAPNLAVIHIGAPPLFDFLAAYFDGTPIADFNADGAVSVQDFYDYLTVHFGGL
jgi:hypothetical protein